jgi:hypothetical protein
MEEKTILEREKELYLSYVAKYGGGHTIVRQFRAYLMNGPRAGEARRMLQNAQDDARAAANEFLQLQNTIEVKQSAPTPVQVQQEKPAQQLLEPLPPQTAQSEGGEVVVVDEAAHKWQTEFRADLSANMSNVQLAAKYNRTQLITFGVIVNAEIGPDMSEKQIVAAIKKAYKA